MCLEELEIAEQLASGRQDPKCAPLCGETQGDWPSLQCTKVRLHLYSRPLPGDGGRLQDSLASIAQAEVAKAAVAKGHRSTGQNQREWEPRGREEGWELVREPREGTEGGGGDGEAGLRKVWGLGE